jgi:transcriptional regulator with XRE-family HTH domain
LGKNSGIQFNILIKKLREERGLSTRQLADLAGFSSAYISKIESGTIPSSKFLARLLEVLECTPEEILFIIGILTKVDDES